jgi:adenylate cyclase
MLQLRTLAVAAIVLTGILVLRGLGWLVGPELLIHDQYLRIATATERPPSPVVLVELTESDIEELAYPMSDRDLARLLHWLADAGALAIALDLYRDLPVPPGERELSTALRDEPRIIAVWKALGHGIRPPLALSDRPERIGFNDLPQDEDGVFRRALLFLDDSDGEVQWSFALRVALLALAAEGIAPAPDPERPELLRLGPTTLPYFLGDDGGYVGADDGAYQIPLDFAAHGRFDRVTVGAVLRGEVLPELLRGRVAMVGGNAESVRDAFPVPVAAAIPGMTYHAHAVDQLLRHARGVSKPRRVLAEWQEVALIALVSAVGCMLGFGIPGRPILGTVAQVAAGLAGVAALWLLGAFAFVQGWWIPTVSPALAWVGSAGVATAWISSREREERDQALRIFGLQSSPEVAAEIWRNRHAVFSEGRVRPRRVECSVMFVDLKGYTAQATRMEPERLMSWTNAFMGRMTDVIQAHGGYVDDYFGDGIKAEFGIPLPRGAEDAVGEDARRAAACAIEIADAVVALNAQAAELDLPRYRARVGLHTGAVVTGSIGSAARMKYTVVGDVVVVAQRLESTDSVDHEFEEMPVRILISESTRAHLGEDFAVKPCGRRPLKGYETSFAVFQILGRSSL